jgi:hypothetical protein
LRGDDAHDVVGGEELALDVTESRRTDRHDWVTVELEFGLGLLKERHQHRSNLLASARSGLGPPAVDELPKP